jgi:anti-sigma B factor antagonist
MAVRGSSSGGRRGSSGASAEAPAAGNSNGTPSRQFARRGIAGAGQRFAVATEQLDDGTPVVCVMGEVDLATVPALEQTLLGAGENRPRAMIVDLTGCTFLDSSGLRALIETRTRLQRSNRPMALVLSNPSVLRIFEISGCDELFEIYPALGAAVDANGNADGHGARSAARLRTPPGI